MSERVLVFSDTHLTTIFKPKKFALLRQLVDSVDRVIINGDFFDGYLISYAEFIASEWRQLFPLLKAKKTVYLPGNHDRAVLKNDAKMFCDQVAKKFSFEQSGKSFQFLHGDGIDRTFDVRHPNTPMWLKRMFSNPDETLCRIFGRRLLVLYNGENKILKGWKLKNLPENDWLICGHTHLAELDKTTKYANSGLFLSEKLASYLIIENGNISLHYIDG